MSTITAIVSGYYSEDFIETRLINLARHPVETVLVCQAGSAEHEVGRQYGVKIHLTYNIPTLYKAWNIAVRDATGEFLVVLEPIHRFPSRYALHGGPKFTPDGRYVFFASRDGWISKFDIWNLKVVAERCAPASTRATPPSPATENMWPWPTTCRTPWSSSTPS